MKPTPGRLVLAALLAAAGCNSTPNDAPPHDGAAASAGGASGGTDAAGANCGASNLPVDPTAMIDDMEATPPPILMLGGRTGSWWAGGDAVSPSATITPNGDASGVAIPNGGRCGSLHAMRVSGQGFTSWAVLTASMAYGAVDAGMGLLPYDAHIRTGITFWARIGDTSAADVRYAVSDMYSRPEGGICDATITTGPTACYDTFGVDLPKLSTTWTQYQIPFSGLGQRQFGLQRPSLDTSAIYTIDFNFNVGEIFDFWVDDISFY